MKRIRSSKKGFTLVEIMCVVAIIVILLSAVGTGVYDTYKRSKNSIIVVGNEHNKDLENVNTAADKAIAGQNVSVPSEEKSNAGSEFAGEAMGHSGQALDAAPSGGSAPLGGSIGPMIDVAPEEKTPEVRKEAVNAILGDKLQSKDVATDIGKMIVSNKANEVNQYLKDHGVEGAEVYISNTVTPYCREVLMNNGHNPNDFTYAKIVSVTTDGKDISERKVGEKIEAVQYFYYETKTGNPKYMVLFGTREIETTFRKSNYRDGLKFDDYLVDTDGSSWTKVG